MKALVVKGLKGVKSKMLPSQTLLAKNITHMPIIFITTPVVT